MGISPFVASHHSEYPERDVVITEHPQQLADLIGVQPAADFHEGVQ